MKKENDNPFDALKKIFHEPSRLAIMSAICAADHGLSFKELKDTCELTDGNLNRHLKVLVEADAVTIEKKFVGAKPRTTVYLSDSGLQHFNQYLEALSQVLEQAKESLPADSHKHSFVSKDAKSVSI